MLDDRARRVTMGYFPSSASAALQRSATEPAQINKNRISLSIAIEALAREAPPPKRKGRVKRFAGEEDIMPLDPCS
jgi:hypothetical protein